jgi:hypothetical protein
LLSLVGQILKTFVRETIHVSRNNDLHVEKFFMLENFIILNNKSVTFRSDNIMSITLNTGSHAEATRNPLTISTFA